MCGMTETGVRALKAIPRPGKYTVARGNSTGTEMYIYTREGTVLTAMKPLYIINVRAKFVDTEGGSFTPAGRPI